MAICMYYDWFFSSAWENQCHCTQVHHVNYCQNPRQVGPWHLGKFHSLFSGCLSPSSLFGYHGQTKLFNRPPSTYQETPRNHFYLTGNLNSTAWFPSKYFILSVDSIMFSHFPSELLSAEVHYLLDLKIQYSVLFCAWPLCLPRMTSLLPSTLLNFIIIQDVAKTYFLHETLSGDTSL